MTKRKLRIFSWLATGALLLTSVLPQIVFAAPSPKVSTSYLEESASADKKINSSVKAQFKNQKTATFLVKLAKQADTKKVAADTAKKAKQQKQTFFKTELMKRSAVVSTLRTTADETQQNLKRYLASQKKAGKVKQVQSFYIVNAMSVTATEDVMKKLAAFPEVDKILPNEKRKIIAPHSKKTSTTSSERVLSIQSQISSVEWNVERVGAPQVWSQGIDGTGVVVANIDTGVQWDHPALKEKYRGYNPADPSNPSHQYNWFDAVNGQTAPYDDLAHGTHTMGTMVGSEPNGANQIGVAPGAKWIAVKAFAEDGGTDVDLLEAGEWILAPKDSEGNPHPEQAPDIVNNSWGGGPGLDEWYRPMVQNWRAADIFPEFSAGNDGPGSGTIANPANYPESVSTGATDIDNNLASFSSRGPSPYNNELKPEISAPGVNVRSAVPGSGYEGGWSGTSMAGPHVSAVAALLKQVAPTLTVDEMEQILLSTATPLTDATYPTSPNNGYGHGLVNAVNAIAAVRQGLGTVSGQVVREGEDTEPPTFQHTPVTEAYAKDDLPLTINVQDNVSIKSVELEYKIGSGTWQTAPVTLIGGNYRNATYQGIVPGSVIEGTSLEYRWKLNDYGNNEVMSDIYPVTIKPGITVGYMQDFESYPSGWSSYGNQNTWEWGVPTSGPGNAASGEKVYATNLEGPYDDNANMSLKMPPIELPTGTTYLQFKHWYALETGFDYANVYISTDQVNWTSLATFNGQSGNWLDAQVDLSTYAGQRVYIVFNVSSDVSITDEGWYLDDVKLSSTPLTTNAIKQTVTKKTKLDGQAAKATKKKAVDSSKLCPTKITKVKSPSATVKTTHTQPLSLPLNATVSVLETGRSTNTNPADGSYSMLHPAGTYTLRAETYGYRSKDQTVEIPRDGNVQANFTLDEIPKGTVSGIITNQVTKQPVANATLYLVEDAAVTPVKTDANGHYTIQAYEGSYTLHIGAANYYSQDQSVTITGNGNTEVNVELKPFIGYPGEIGYDDGVPENARAFYEPGNGWAVKMSLAEGKSSAMVTGGLFRFWDTEWPVPGGTDFQVAVYDASGPDGAPGKKLAGPINATALRNGEWTEVDLSEHGIFVNGDFYLLYLQTTPYPNSPGIGTDESSDNSGRNWEFFGGSWAPAERDLGNFMIRARVSYEVTPPVITSPTDGSFTNQSTITVEGKSALTTQVHLFNKGKEVASTPAKDDGTFSVQVPVSVGENILTATASTSSGTTDPSEPVKVIVDQTKPELTITSPTDGWKTNREAVTVQGKATDSYLDRVLVNGKKATVQADGSYSYRLLLNEGENTITVRAIDKAGNRTTKRVKVYAKFTPPTVTNVKPTADVYLKAGQTVQIELDSQQDLDATFRILMPLTNPKTSSVVEFPMREVSDGHYVGYYTANSNVKASGATIEVIVRDDYGNETRVSAPGKLYINTKK